MTIKKYRKHPLYLHDILVLKDGEDLSVHTACLKAVSFRLFCFVTKHDKLKREQLLIEYESTAI